MDLSDFLSFNAAPQQPTGVDDTLLRRFISPPATVKFANGGSALGIATPRQQEEVQRIRQVVQDKVMTPATNAITDPFYAFSPGTDARRQEARHRILEKVNAATTDPMMGTFAGTGAKLADKAALAKSLEMKAAGIPDKEIWQATGWTHGFPDGKPRFEIPDNISAVTGKEGVGSLQDFYKHPQLYAAYPELKHAETSVTKIRGSGSEGAYTPAHKEWFGEGVLPERFEINSTDKDIHSILTHEAQHAIQEREGFATGGRVEAPHWEEGMPEIEAWYDNADRMERLKDAVAEIDKHSANGGKGKVYIEGYAENGISKTQAARLRQEIQQEIDGIIKQGNYTDPVADYERIAGEVESRLTQRRMSLNAEQRRAQYPVEQMDVPPEQQIVRFK